MGQTELFSVFLIFAVFVGRSMSYELVFNTDKDILQWKFNGSYIYSKSIPNVAALLPMSLVQSSRENDVFRVGVWLTRYSGPDAENYLSLQYALKHHLFKQGMMHFIASPNVPITVTTKNNVEIGKFWSNGRTWCDAFFNVDLENIINIGMSTPDLGDYVLIDKIILGVMQNIQMNGRKLNPCLTSPPGNNTLTDDDLAPDMAHKPPPPYRNGTREDHTPPDMASKPSHHHLHGSSGGNPPPDMMQKPQTPKLDTSTTTTSDDNNAAEPPTGDSSDVKCGCSCSCTRVRGMKSSNNATMIAG